LKCRNVEIKEQNEETMIRKRFISLLTNSTHYYLTWALIVLEGDRCRLMVKLRKEVVTDAVFNTLEDARGAFLSIYQHRVSVGGVKPRWTSPYPPDEKWLRERVGEEDEKSVDVPEKSFFGKWGKWGEKGGSNIF
jgi:hypothetical protein